MIYRVTALHPNGRTGCTVLVEADDEAAALVLGHAALRDEGVRLDGKHSEWSTTLELQE